MAPAPVHINRVEEDKIELPCKMSFAGKEQKAFTFRDSEPQSVRINSQNGALATLTANLPTKVAVEQVINA